MTDPDLAHLVSQLQRHEGVRLRPYRDTVGKLSIGVGRNLDDRGISRDEADYLLGNDLETAQRDCEGMFSSWYPSLDSVRQAALVNICFNLGAEKLLSFERALGAMAAKQYGRAAREFLDSKWARQVGQRAVELCAQIKTGQWQR